MTPERWQQIERIFEAALDCAPAKRISFLDQACGEDAELRREVESLLSADEAAADKKTAGFHHLIGAGMMNHEDDNSIIGQTLGHYRIDSLLGSGGMGKVYLAKDTSLRRQVAIKILPSQFMKDPDRVRRFEQEARAASSLNHPNIITIHEIGRFEKTRFIVTELIDGHTLRRRMESGPMNLPETLKIAHQIVGALATAHAAGIVHRDIKPENVMVRSDGLVKVLDFGLAKLRPEHASGGMDLEASTKRPLTGSGVVMGTVGYMSPEQVRGQNADHRSDLFSFGIMLYEMLSGQRPFQGESAAEAMAAIVKDDPPELSRINGKVPAQLERIVRRCLEKEPERRFQSATDLGFALESLPSTSVTLPETASVAERTGHRWRPSGNSRSVWGVTILAVLGLLATLPFAISYFRPAAPAAARPIKFSLNLPEKMSLMSIALSPDGHRLAINVRDASGQTMLYLRPLDAEQFQKLDGTEGAFYHFWSPDSRSIGFFARGKLKRIEASGGSPQIICSAEDGLGGTWNRDGMIAFTGKASSGLYRVSAIGGEPSPLTTLDVLSRMEQSHRWPRFLADGRSFIYLSLSGIPENQAIYLGSLDGNVNKRLFRADSNAVFVSPGYLIFDRQGATMTQAFDTRKLVTVGEPFPITEILEPVSKELKLTFLLLDSENGTLAYHKADRNKMQLSWFDRRGRQMGKLVEGDYHNPLISPDGKWVAFDGSDPLAPGEDIWLVELARENKKRITFDPVIERIAVWSPDSSRIVFGKKREIYFDLFQKSVNSAGKDEPLWKSESHKVPNDWSLDGRFITFFNRDPITNDDIWVLPMDGDRRPFPLLNTAFNEDQARFSPNGKWIAYTSDESGKPQIYVQSFPLSGAKWAVSTGGGDQPRWRRDGRELFYLAADGNLMSVEVKTDGRFEVGIPRPLFEIPASDITSRYQRLYTVTPDGQRFLVRSPVEKNQSSTITVVLNWTSLLPGTQ